MSRKSIRFGSAALLGLALAAPATAGATLRTANFSWAPAPGPVYGYVVYASVDGGPEQLYGYVGQASAAIDVASGASLTVSVAAFDVTGFLGPHSDASPPLRLCPGDFDGDQLIGLADLSRAGSCLNRLAEDACAGADMNDDGYVTIADYLSLRAGSNACPPLSPAARCIGDMDGDGSVTSTDLFGARTCVGLQASGNCVLADFDGSGFVTMSDLIAISRIVGTQGCSP